MIECVLTAVDEIMALENITDCPVSEINTFVWKTLGLEIVIDRFETICQPLNLPIHIIRRLHNVQDYERLSFLPIVILSVK